MFIRLNDYGRIKMRSSFSLSNRSESSNSLYFNFILICFVRNLQANGKQQRIFSSCKIISLLFWRPNKNGAVHSEHVKWLEWLQLRKIQKSPELYDILSGTTQMVSIQFSWNGNSFNILYFVQYPSNRCNPKQDETFCQNAILFIQGKRMVRVAEIENKYFINCYASKWQKNEV